MTSVQALESMRKLGEINGLTGATLDIEGIRADLVRTNDSWQERGFPQLVDALRRWTERNPISQEERGRVQIVGKLARVHRNMKSSFK